MPEETGFTVQGALWKPDTVVLKEGEKKDAVYWLETGRVAVSRRGQKLYDLPAGAIVGAASVLLGEPQLFTVVSVAEPATFAKVYLAHDLQHVFTVNPQILVAVFAALETEASLIEKRLSEQSLAQITDAMRRADAWKEQASKIVAEIGDAAVAIAGHPAASTAGQQIAGGHVELDPSPGALSTILSERTLLRTLDFCQRTLAISEMGRRIATVREILKQKARAVAELSLKIV
ncbi:MAG: cyclic nucleotide-binding domain-containing protein [Acidobacteriota bacterium]